MVNRGIIDPEFATKAKDYLTNSEKDNSTVGRTDLRGTQPGTVGPDCSIYQ